MQGELPAWMLPRPDWAPTPEQARQLQRWFAREVRPGGGRLVTPPDGLPVWQTLAWLGDSGEVLLHGTGDPDIGVFEPRQAAEDAGFGAQRAVYAASDGLWAMFYAVVDRVRQPMTIVNGAFRLERRGQFAGPFYFFSVSDVALARGAFRTCWVYLLPGAGFVQEPPRPWGEFSAHTGHWASQNAVRPLARLAVRPEDFPFLEAVRGHDEAQLHRRMCRHPEAFPWLDAP